MLKGIKTEASGSIRLIEENRDEVFVVCASFEDRTTAVIDSFSEGYKVSTSFIFKYDEKNIICDHHDPLDGLSKFRDLCKSKGVVLEGNNMTIDITTFTKQYLLVLLRFIEKQEPKSVRLFYSEPEDYAIKWDKPLSYGLIDIVSVPSYGGHFYVF